MRELQEKLNSAFKPTYEWAEKLRRAFGFRCRSYFGAAGQEVAMRLDIPCEDGSSWSTAVEIGAKALLRTPDEIRQLTNCELEALARAWLAQDDYRCRDTFDQVGLKAHRLRNEGSGAEVTLKIPSSSYAAERVAEYVRENPGQTGKQIEAGLKNIYTHGYIRKLFSEYLCDWGYRNLGGGKGYWPPTD